MCGRFARTEPVQRYAQYLSEPADGPGGFEQPAYNITPGVTIPAFCRLGSGTIGWRGFHWGYRPAWTGDGGKAVINARVETVASKPYFRQSFADARRLLIPASGWFEWQRDQGKRQPYYFSPPQGPLFFAGLYTQLPQSDSTETRFGATILTCQAPAPLGEIHHRMPLLVQASADLAAWLSGKPLDANWIDRRLRSELPEIRYWAVSAKVNRAGTDGAELIEPKTGD